MKNTKRLLDLILAMVLLIGCLPFSVFAQETASGTCGQNLTWTFDEKNGTLTIDGTGAMTNYTSELAPWHSFRESIASVSFPNGITTIGDDAFDGCSKLTSIIIPDEATYIGMMAFAACRNMTSITIPESVTTIGNGAFFWYDSLPDFDSDCNNSSEEEICQSLQRQA